MKCPRCQHVFSATPDEAGIVTCPSCNSRLRARPAAAGARPAASAAAPNEAAAKGPRPAPSPVAAPAAAPLASKGSTAPAEAPRASVVAMPAPAPAPGAPLDAVLEELRAIREGQQEILDLLRQQPPPPPGPLAEPLGVFGDDDRPATPAPAAVRSRRRKTVLLIDDDAETRATAVDALERAEVPVRAFADGNAGLAGIAEEKPDVIVMELGIKGAMAGKDVINMIKATMEWVDVPIVLYTRMPIENQREARQIHGADEYVLKGPASADALVGRVIAVFRRG